MVDAVSLERARENDLKGYEDYGNQATYFVAA